MKKLTANFLSLTASEILRKIFGFLAVAYLARRLSVSEFGLVSLAFTVLSYTLNISTAGLNLFGIRESVRTLDHVFTGRLVSLRLVFGATVFLVTVAAAQILVADPLTVKLIVLFNCTLFAQALVLDWYFQGKEAMRTVSIGKSVTAAVYLILLLMFVKRSQDLLYVGYAAVGGDVAMMLFFLLRFRNEGGRLRPVIDIPVWKDMIKQAIPLGVGTVLGQISINLAPLALAILMTTTEVGLYSAASKLVVFLLLFDRVLGVLLLPASARLHAVAPAQLGERLSDALKWILLTALPICVGGMLVANDMIRLVFGENFVAAAELFRILIWFLCFTMIHTVYTSGLIAVAPSNVYGRVMSISALVYLISIGLLTKFFGIHGTVFAVVLSEGITLLVARANLRPYLQLRPKFSLLWIACALAAMIATVVALQAFGMFVRVSVGAAIYIAALVVLRIGTVDEFAALVWRKPS